MKHRRAALAAALSGAVALAAGPAGAEVPGVALPRVPVIEGPALEPARGYPVWIKDHASLLRTEETSDIVFLGRDADGRRLFFLVDEIGMIWACRVEQPGDTGRVDLRLERVGVDRTLSDALQDRRRWDFEALALLPPGAAGDRTPDSLRAWLSVEGHGPAYVAETTVLEVVLRRRADADPAAWTIGARGEAFPRAHFWERQVGADRGIAGIGVGARFAYLGLARGESDDEVSSVGTVIYVFDRALGKVAYVATRGLGIGSVGGIDARGDTLTFVIDRGQQSLFVLGWDTVVPGVVTQAFRFPLDMTGPGGFRYAIPWAEGVAVDDVGDVWCVTDPERGLHRTADAVPESTRVYLAAEIPMLYRFPGEQVWRMTGMDHGGRTGER